jgi:hypothetical protein
MNQNAHRIFHKPFYEWNGYEMVGRPANHLDVKQAVDASRGDSIFAPVHIPVERMGKEQ